MTQLLSTFVSGFGPTGPTGPSGPTAQGYIAGLTLSNDATSPNTVIDIAIGSAVSDDNTTTMNLVSPYTKTTGAWAVGTANGGLDTGTVALSTWYHVYVIERTDTLVVDVLISLSATAPTMPTIYTKKRRIGSIRTDASVHLLAFSQNGNEFLWAAPVADMNAVSVSTTAQTPTLTVPTGIKVNAIFNTDMVAVTATTLALFNSMDQPVAVANTPIGNFQLYISVNNLAACAQLNIRTNTSAQVRVVASAASTISVATQGWIDTRGNAGTGVVAMITGPTGPSGGPTGPIGPTGPVSANDFGRNIIHNALFRVQQRGTGPFTATSYTADRWQLSNTTSTSSATIITLADADRTAIGDEAAEYALQNVATGTAGAGDSAVFVQKIEDIKRLSGKTIIVSFWAKATSGTPKLGLSLSQIFGTGGSPSASVIGIGAQNFTLSTNWIRYTSTPIAIPTAIGATFGTTLGTDFTMLDFWQSSGATSNAAAGSIGVQSYTLQMWGVQLEIGSTATALEKLDPRYDLANCQRFFTTILPMASGAYSAAAASAGAFGLISYPVTMRATPTLVQGSTVAASNLTSLTLTSVNASYGYVTIVQGAGAGNFNGIVNGTASSDL